MRARPASCDCASLAPRPCRCSPASWDNRTLVPEAAPVEIATPPRKSAPPLLVSVRGLWREFSEVPVLRDVALELRDGETLAVLGPNGAGKTTLLRVLATLLRPTAGEVSVLGLLAAAGVLESSRADRLPGPRAAPLSGPDRHGEPRSSPRGFRGLGSGAAGRIAELVERVRMSRRADELVRNLSAGMVQRLAVCRAVLHEPELLLLDEPSSHLDPEAAAFVEPLLAAAPGERGCWSLTTSTRGSPKRTACWRFAPAARSPTRALPAACRRGMPERSTGAHRERSVERARPAPRGLGRCLQGDPRQGPAGRASDA